MNETQEIIDVLSQHFSAHGMAVVNHPSTDYVFVVFQSGELKEFAEGKYISWEELPEESQLFWYAHIVDKASIIDYYLQDNVIELDAEFLEKGNAWKIEGADKVEIGNIIEVVTEEGEQKTTSIMFHSPDLTFATLTAFASTNVDGRKTAKEDIQRIAEELMNWCNHYFKDEETVE